MGQIRVGLKLFPQTPHRLREAAGSGSVNGALAAREHCVGEYHRYPLKIGLMNATDQ